MPEYRFTEYFEREVLRKRPYLRREWRVAVVRTTGGGSGRRSLDSADDTCA
jgi:hypothetical protein